MKKKVKRVELPSMRTIVRRSRKQIKTDIARDAIAQHKIEQAEQHIKRIVLAEGYLKLDWGKLVSVHDDNYGMSSHIIKHFPGMYKKGRLVWEVGK